MNIPAALACGTVLSLAAVSVWAWSADVTIGPAAPLHLGRGLLSDYSQLAGAATGNGWALFGVTALIFAACLFVSGLRALRRAQREESRDDGQYAEDPETAPVYGRWL